MKHLRVGPATLVLWAAAIVVVALSLSVLGWTPTANGMRAQHGVSATWPDPRVQWLEYPVGGLGLIDPDASAILPIPPGSILMVPAPALPDTA